MGCRYPTTPCASRREGVEDPQPPAELRVTLAHSVHIAITAFTTRLMYCKNLHISARVLTLTIGMRCISAPNATSSPGRMTRKRVHGICAAARLLRSLQVQSPKGYCRCISQAAQAVCSKQRCRYHVISLQRWTCLSVSCGCMTTPPLPLHPIVLLLFRISPAHFSETSPRRISNMQPLVAIVVVHGRAFAESWRRRPAHT